jgi:hypothetical protein
MTFLLDHPRLLAPLCLLALLMLALLGALFRRRLNIPEERDRATLSTVIAATLTLLGLIIGFTFSMASSRYDQRKLYEEEEANAIGTEYLRADLMPPAQAVPVKHLLQTYLTLRIDFYESTADPSSIDASTSALQTQLWQSLHPLTAQPTPISALILSGMNDVLNTQGYTQFSWNNRIPTAAWGLMIVIALFANALLGYSAQQTRPGILLLLILPALVAVSFFLIADIDSPRGGIIRIAPVNLISLSRTLQAPTH